MRPPSVQSPESSQVVGQPFRARAFVRALEHIAGHGDVWLTTSDEIADWYFGQL